ncbi:MAG: DNA polymerase I [Clostridia bacterium]|nr:DNA polymerase I [Clostridia bacterium]
MNKIILIDGNSLLHRAYHALPNLKTSRGFYTGAIFGFLRLITKLVKEHKPTHMAVAFDLKAPTFRHLRYAEYKGTRKPMDPELAMQIEPLKELLELMAIKVVSKEGYEADDILGTLSKRFYDETYIVTGDRDSFQLVSNTTTILWTKKGVTDIEFITPQWLLDDGFTVDTFIDYKALRGDPSDNIPGVKGVGEKTARDLLATYGSLAGVYAHQDEIKGKLGDTIRASYDLAMLSRELATIECNAPIDCTLEDMTFNAVYSGEVKRKLGEMELNSITAGMAFNEEETGETNFEKTVVEIDTLDGIDKALKGDKVALLIRDRIAFSVDGKTEHVISCGDDLFAELTFDVALDRVKTLISGKTLICYDYKSLSKEFDIEADKFFDVMIATHLVRESAPIKSIDACLGGDGYEVGSAELFDVSRKLQKSLVDMGLDKLFYEVEQPLAVVLKKMEQRGFAVDVNELDALKDKYGTLVSDLTAKIYDSVGFEFNVASPKQLGEVLFERLGLRHGKKTKTGYSVGEDVLQNLVGEHPVIALILEYRHYAKLLSTYVVGLQPLVNRGRIHTEFNQCITQTGRLSSTNPNLQNIPVRREESRDIKKAFIPSKGCKLVSADYSQIELRLLAHFSEDSILVDAYNSGADVHTATASQIFGVEPTMVTSDMRRDAKAVNFGIIYGMSDFGLAEQLGISQWRAKEFIERYFEKYPTVKAYLDGNVQKATEKGYSTTLLGRRRNLQDLTASNYLVRTGAQRMAKNTPLQGSAADIIKLAMIAVDKRLEGMKSKMILQVHDELIIDAYEDEVDEVKAILEKEMANAVKLNVPLVAEAVVGDSWADL